MFSLLKKHKDIQNFFLYFSPAVLSLVAGLFTFSVYSKSIMAEDYGIVANLIIYCTILYVFFSYGLSVSGQKVIYVDSKPYEKRLGNFVIFFIINFIFVFIVVFLLRNVINKIFFDGNATLGILFLGPVQVFLSSIKNIPLEIYRSQKQAGLYAGLTVLFTAIEPGIIFYYLLFGDITLQTIIGIKYFSFISASALFFFFSIKHISFSLDIKDLMENIKVGLPNVPALLSNWLVKGSDRIFLTHFYNLATVGVYSANIKIEHIVNSLLIALNNTLFPDLIKNAKNKHENSHVLKFAMAIFSMFALAVLFFGKEFIVIFSKKEYFVSNLIFILIAIYSFLFFLQHVFWPYLIVNNKINYSAFVKFAGAFFNVCANYFLIKYFSFIGAALATLISHLFIVLLLYRPITKDIPVISIVLNVSIFVLSGIFVFVFQSTVPIFSYYEIGVKIFVYIGAVVLLFIANHINPVRYMMALRGKQKESTVERFGLHYD